MMRTPANARRSRLLTAACVVAALAAAAITGLDSRAVDVPLDVVVGRPTDRSVAISVFGPAGTEVSIAYGEAGSGERRWQTAVETLDGQAPAVLVLDGLAADAAYDYELDSRATGAGTWESGRAGRVRTARAAGSSFSFGVQGDSHPERVGRMFAPELYGRNARNVQDRRPDFYVALGDDFSIEHLIERGALVQEAVDEVYRRQRDFFGVFAHSTALFLVNGNHEQAAGYLLGDRYDTPYDAAPVLAGRARVTWFPLPVTDGFYDVDPMEVPGVGPVRDYYAFEWGDALFVMLDPYWHSPVPVDSGVPGVPKIKDQWLASIGDAQYAWLVRTLEASRARYRFVFEHHVLGSGRGAAALVHTFEWGGYNQKGTAYEFRSRRPGWERPLHQLFRDTGVTAVFVGHDHLFAREIVDGIVYQSVPNPADDTYTAFNADAYAPASVALPGAAYDRALSVVRPNSGYLHVTVQPDAARVDYIRAVLPGDEQKAGGANGTVAFTYDLTPRETRAGARR